MSRIIILSTIILSFLSCEDLDEYSRVNQATSIEDITEFTINRKNLFANANDTTLLSVSFINNENFDIDTSKAKVKFNVSNGTIKESKTTEYEISATFSQIDNFEKQSANATFISSNLGYSNVIITVTIDLIKLYDTINYTDMPVGEISLLMDQFQLINKFDSVLLIGGTAVGSQGYPTKGQKININVYDSTFNRISSDVNFKSDNLSTKQDGSFSILFSSGNLRYEGKSYIIGSLDKQDTSIADTVTLFLKNIP